MPAIELSIQYAPGDSGTNGDYLVIPLTESGSSGITWSYAEEGSDDLVAAAESVNQPIVGYAERDGLWSAVVDRWDRLPTALRCLLLTAVAVTGLWWAWSESNQPVLPIRSTNIQPVSSLIPRDGLLLASDSRSVLPAGINNIPPSVFDPAKHPDWRLKTLSIEDIRVGMRVPALNPSGAGGGVSELELMARAYGVPISQLRTFTLHVAVDDGSVQEIQLVRPASWVARNVILAAAIAEDLEYHADVEFQSENPWTALGLNTWNELTVNPVERMAALAGDGFESVRWAMPLASASPTSFFTSIVSRFQSDLAASLLEQVESDELVSRLEREILDGQAIGAELYVELEELGLEGWATLEAVGPARNLTQASEQIDPANHRLLRLVASRADGSRTDITLIRSVDWIRENLGEAALESAQSDAPTKLRLDIPELRLNDYADVTAIEPCPSIKTGPGEVVTATYHTDRAKVIDLRFERSSEPVGTTAEHPFWSVSRQAFVPAGMLEIGEQVVTISGESTRLSDISPRDGPESVYNFEVAGLHTYFVSNDGVLVHNAVYIANLFHGTSIDSAVGLLNGKKLLKSRAAARHLGEGKIGLYLSTHLDDAMAFGRRHAGAKGFTVLNFQFTQKALDKLKKAGVVPGPIPGTPKSVRTIGKQVFVGPESFSLFNRLLNSGDINIIPFLR